jgi:hypothetical protein
MLPATSYIALSASLYAGPSPSTDQHNDGIESAGDENKKIQVYYVILE